MPRRRKKRIMRAFKLNEVSAVDRPAQEGARMTIIKRADDETDNGYDVLKAAFMTDDGPEQDHAHLIIESGETAGFTSMSGKDRENWHSHPWIKASDGSIIVGADNGHSHALRDGTMKMLLTKEQAEHLCEGDEEGARDGVAKVYDDAISSGVSLPDGSFAVVDEDDVPTAVEALSLVKDRDSEYSIEAAAHVAKRAEALDVELQADGEVAKLFEKAAEKAADHGGGTTGKKEKTMTTGKSDKSTDKAAKKGEGEDKSLEEQVSDLTKKQEQTDEELRVAKAYGNLNDAEKEFYGNLDVEEAADFLEKSADERKAMIEKANEKDKVVYTAEDGTEYRKSDDPRLVKQAKANDEMAKKLRESEEKREEQELAKRAKTEIGYLPGDDKTKSAVLKAIDGIEDEETRKAALESIKAGDKAIQSAFKTAGRTEAAEGSPADELEKGAKALQKSHKEETGEDLSFEAAYEKFANTDEGRALYEKTLS